MRFNADVSSLEEAGTYYCNRVIQLLPYGWSWDGILHEILGGAYVVLKHEDGKKYHSAIIFKQHCGKGYMKRFIEERQKFDADFRYVSAPMCKKMVSWLNYVGVDYILFEPHFTPEYLSIQRKYGDTRASRSGQYYMNHIDEGMYILRQLYPNQSEEAERAFCLHPLVQDDAELQSCIPMSRWSHRALMHAMEYRHVANAFLPPNTWDNLKEPKKSVLDIVNQMLVADKIQNCKDFELYVKKNLSSDRQIELSTYFARWFEVLNIEHTTYQKMKKEIQHKTGRG